MPVFVPPPLYVICDQEICERAGWSVVDFASACLQGGARLLQLRAKHATGQSLLATAEAMVRRAKAVDARVIVNDRADVARLAGADGVHVGQEDLTPTAVRRVAPDAIVGLSTHTAAQVALGLEQQVDYLAVGPVFGTTTKSTGYREVGLEFVREASDRAAVREMAIVAIGGITLDRARDVLAAGARSVAVISDLFVGGDPTARVRRYVDLLKV